MNKDKIEVVDANGVVRVRIASPAPGPVIDGIERKRDMPVSGIQFNDSAGNEIGGIGMVDGTRCAIFALDYAYHEAVKVVAADMPEGHAAIISLSEKVPFDLEKGPQRNHERIELRVQDGLPSLIFRGKDGKPRITIGLDGDDHPIIEITDRTGAVCSLVPK